MENDLIIRNSKWYVIWTK